MNKSATVALVVLWDSEKPILIDALSSDEEIQLLENSIHQKKTNPLSEVYKTRKQSEAKEEEFADFVEALLTQPFVRSEIVKQGVEWFKSKVRFENYQKSEDSAAQIIAEYAFDIFLENPLRNEFILVSGEAEVHIKVFICAALSQEKARIA